MEIHKIHTFIRQ